MTPGQAIEWAREKATSERGKALVAAAELLLEVAWLAARVRTAQRAYWDLRRRAKPHEREQVRAALEDAVERERELDAALERAGLGRQQRLPVGESEG